MCDQFVAAAHDTSAIPCNCSDTDCIEFDAEGNFVRCFDENAVATTRIGSCVDCVVGCTIEYNAPDGFSCEDGDSSPGDVRDDTEPEDGEDDTNGGHGGGEGMSSATTLLLDWTSSIVLIIPIMMNFQ
jgi:hypothetical protein